jgi:hypothetical protein
MKSTVTRAGGSLLKKTLLIITFGTLFVFQSTISAGEGIIITGVVETSILDNGDITSVLIDLRLEEDTV